MGWIRVRCVAEVSLSVWTRDDDDDDDNDDDDNDDGDNDGDDDNFPPPTHLMLINLQHR